MILSAEEAKVMCGWMALFVIRAMQFCELSKKGATFKAEDLRAHPLFGGMLESDTRIPLGESTIGLMKIGLNTIEAANPGFIYNYEIEGDTYYEVLDPAGRRGALAAIAAEVADRAIPG